MDGNFEIHLAPLQGYTDGEFRHLFEHYFGGIDAYYTPFIRSEDDGSLRRKDVREMTANTLPSLIPQILPGSADELRRMVRQVTELGFSRIDINMGCPFPMIVRRGRGCGLLADTDRAIAVLQALDEFPNLSFSLKMRLGQASADESMTLLAAINAAPFHHVVLHPRLGIQQYKGECDRVAFRPFYESCRHPLFYNGDLCTVADVQSLKETFPALQGVMIGRGILADPLLPRRIRGEELPPLQHMQDFHNALFDSYQSHLQGDAHLLAKMKSLWEYFLASSDKKLLKAIHKAGSIRNYKEAVNQFFKNPAL